MSELAGGRPALGAVARAWGRIGVIGFGGPPAHIALLRELVVERRRWMPAEQFECALSYGGGFVIIPLMQADAVERYGWMTDTEFLNAVALGQVTPGPVTHTVAAVGYAAAGVPGAVVAAFVAFAPSFAFVLVGARNFDRFLANADVRRFFDGAGPAAIGAILGRDPALVGVAGDVAVGRAGGRCRLPLRAPARRRPHAARGRCGRRSRRAALRAAPAPLRPLQGATRSYQPEVPPSPLNGPTMSEVIQPP